MIIDQNLVRWMTASIYKWFDERKQSIPLFLEGADRTQQALLDYAELRLNGPFLTNPSEDFYNINVDINVLLTVSNDQADAYKLQRLIGIILIAYTRAINVYKFGTDGDDSLLGCLVLQNEITI